MRQIKFRAWDGRSMDRQWKDGRLVIDASNGEPQKVMYGSTPFTIEVPHDIILMQYTGLLDRNGVEIYEGDIVLGEQYYVSSDGYKRKKYPNTIKVVCVVEYRRGSFEHTRLIGPSEVDREAYEQYSYRGIGYWLYPSSKGSFSWNPKTEKFDIEGDDQTCPTIEVIGNVYENPELLAGAGDAR